MAASFQGRFAEVYLPPPVIHPLCWRKRRRKTAAISRKTAAISHSTVHQIGVRHRAENVHHPSVGGKFRTILKKRLHIFFRVHFRALFKARLLIKIAFNYTLWEMEEDAYQKYVEDTLERKDLEGLFGIWRTSLDQGSFGERTRLLLVHAVPTLAKTHQLILEENNFRELIEKYDDERVLQIARREKKYLRRFLVENDLSALKRVLPFEKTTQILKAVEGLKTAPTLRVLRCLVPAVVWKRNTFEKLRFFGSLAFLAGKADYTESIDYLHTVNPGPGQFVLNAALGGATDINLIERLLARDTDPKYLLQGMICRNDWILLDYYKTKYSFNEETLQSALLYTAVQANYEMMRHFFELGAQPTEDILDVPAVDGDLQAIDIFVEFGLTKETIASVLKSCAENDFSEDGYVKYTLAQRGTAYLQKLLLEL